MEDPDFEVVLARHGQTEWSRAKKHTGRTDIALTDQGEAEARALAPTLASMTYDRVLASPLQRAWRTAELAGFGARRERVDDLMEWDYGDFEGRLTAEIREDRPGWLLWRDGTVGGEQPDDIAVRIDRVIDDIVTQGGRTLVFAHGHILRSLTARWLEFPVLEGRRFTLDTGTYSVLGCYRGERVVKTWNAAPAATTSAPDESV